MPFRPKRKRKYAIKVTGGGRLAGEYDGCEAGLAATVKRAKADFLPHLEDRNALHVVHFSSDGERVFYDKTIRDTKPSW
jgi:hypothetical protein